MTSKLMTLQELAEYLQISEEKIRELVDLRILVAYKIGGELLRFRKEQIDAIRSEIESRTGKADRIGEASVKTKTRESLTVAVGSPEKNTFNERIADFFYFNDFYILSGVVVVVLLAFIFHG